MKITKKLRDLFVVNKGGGKTLLKSGKRYLISRAGAISELDNTDTEEFDQYALSSDYLLALGERGDLRQLETLQRNLSVLFSRMANVNELYDTIPSEQSPQTTRSMVYDCDGTAACYQVRIRGTEAESVSFTVFGSNGDNVWEPLGGEVVHTFTTTNTLETVDLSRDTAKYRYFKLVQSALDSPEVGYNNTPIASLVFLLTDKAVEKFFPQSETGQLEALVTKVHDMSLYIDGTPTDGQTLYKFVLPETMYVKADFAGFQLTADTPPVSRYEVSVQHNGVAIGTLALTSEGTIEASPLDRHALQVGDYLSLVGGVADGVGDLSITFLFERTASA